MGRPTVLIGRRLGGAGLGSVLVPPTPTTATPTPEGARGEVATGDPGMTAPVTMRERRAAAAARARGRTRRARVSRPPRPTTAPAAALHRSWEAATKCSARAEAWRPPPAAAAIVRSCPSSPAATRPRASAEGARSVGDRAWPREAVRPRSGDARETIEIHDVVLEVEQRCGDRRRERGAAEDGLGRRQRGAAEHGLGSRKEAPLAGAFAALMAGSFAAPAEGLRLRPRSAGLAPRLSRLALRALTAGTAAARERFRPRFDPGCPGDCGCRGRDSGGCRGRGP